jgi:D-glycero-beta-D-manno-heptose-7-phosphate kinase
MSNLAHIINGFAQKRIVVVGDLIADQFLYGEISRVSREAPVFILRHEQTETIPGGAGNCAMNLAALGGQVTLVSTIGDDDPGRVVLEKLRTAGVNCVHVAMANTQTTTKVRVLAGQIHSTRQQVIRIDYDSDSGLSEPLNQQLRTAVARVSGEADAVIVSDYNYGVADPEIAALVRDTTETRRIPILVDSRFRLSSFPGFTSATPNEDEVEELLGVKHSDQAALELAAQELRQRLGYRALLVTRGGHGMLLVEEGVAPLHIDAVGSSQPVDVTGAGDTVIAAYSLALATGSSFVDAAYLANLAGGLVVMKRGTATVSAAELQFAAGKSTRK